MRLDSYVEKGGQKLRRGYTTGSCAAAAAKAAARMLVTGEKLSYVRLLTPKDIELMLELEDIQVLNQAVSCAVRKDSGDDPDVTNGALVYALVAWSDQPGITIDGGEGVGRVTRPGLDQPVGAAAINSTPRAMIEQAVQEAVSGCFTGVLHEHSQETVWNSAEVKSGGLSEEDAGPDQARRRGLSVTISVPEGRALAEKTFNPKLGIIGGISILGTTGIVEPMSEQALLDTIQTEISVRARERWPILPAAPGNYGKQFFLDAYGFSLDTAVTSSNFICDTVKMAAAAGFTRMLFVGHIGKLVKVAGGIRNTHSQYGDHRMEILADIAEAVIQGAAPAGGTVEKGNTGENPGAPADGSVPETEIPVRSLLADCVSTDEAVRILQARGLAEPVLAEMTRRIQEVMQDWAGGRMQVEAVVFSNVHGELGRTPDAAAYIEELKRFAKD